MKSRDYTNYVKVLYKDPNPILNGYNPEPCMVTGDFQQRAEELKNFEIRKNDVWVLGYPKSGNTWLCELITTIIHDLDFAKIEDGKHKEQMLFLE